MNSTQEKALVVSVLNWIKEHKLPGNRHAAEITEDIDLITDGLLDPMGLVDLLLFVEEQTGRPIDLKAEEPMPYRPRKSSSSTLGWLSRCRTQLWRPTCCWQKSMTMN